MSTKPKLAPWVIVAKKSRLFFTHAVFTLVGGSPMRTDKRLDRARRYFSKRNADRVLAELRKTKSARSKWEVVRASDVAKEKPEVRTAKTLKAFVLMDRRRISLRKPPYRYLKSIRARKGTMSDEKFIGYSTKDLDDAIVFGSKEDAAKCRDHHALGYDNWSIRRVTTTWTVTLDNA